MNGGDVPEVSSVKHEISPKSTNHGSPPDFMKFIKADQAPGPQLIFFGDEGGNWKQWDQIFSFI